MDQNSTTSTPIPAAIAGALKPEVSAPVSPAPVTQVVYQDQEQQNQLGMLATHTAQMTGDTVPVAQVQPVIEQHPLTEEAQQAVEEMSGSDQKDTLLNYWVPLLQKKIRTTGAKSFLGKKMEWLSKKTGSEVGLK